MLPSGLTLSQTILYTAISDRCTNMQMIKNAALAHKPDTIRKSINRLVETEHLSKRQFTYRNELSSKTHTHQFYTLTPQGLNTIATELSSTHSMLFCLDGIMQDLDYELASRVLNGASKERLFRILEVEQFCSAAGVLTRLDPRVATSPACFGNESSWQEGDDNGEAVNKRGSVGRGKRTEYGEVICEAVYQSKMRSGAAGNSNDPYCFYRRVEVLPVERNGGPKPITDRNLLGSQVAGIVANSKKGIFIYRAPRNGGMMWRPRVEGHIRTVSSAFCDRFIPHSRVDTLHPIEDAVIFYSTETELMNLVRGTYLKKPLEPAVFGEPFRHVYAIPFSEDGMVQFKNLLESADYAYDTCERISEAMPDLELEREPDLAQLYLYGDVPCLSVHPLDLRSLMRMSDSVRSREYCLVGRPAQQKLLEKIFPQNQFIPVIF